ncbi:hypothetical protein [Nocardia jinanensis]|nr:hypothetical protein [Nocardia jinanensis]
MLFDTTPEQEFSERVLGMPREARSDHEVAFRDVPRGGRRGTS